MAADFDFQRRLGAGYFGEVWLAYDTGLGTNRAVKLIPPDRVLDKTNFFLEAQILKAVEHPNIVRVEEAGTLTDGRIYVAMEFLEKGSLDDEARGSYVLLTRAQRVMIDMLRGLEYAHTKGIIHRDIKPANILIGAASEAKLSDFGLAVTVGGALGAIAVRDYAYTLHQAPEVASIKDFSVSSDIYASGVTLYRLVNGDSYLPALPMPLIRAGTLAGKFPDRSKYREFVPRSLIQLINKAMNVDPKKRFFSANEMRHALEQIQICMNWQEQSFVRGIRWTSAWQNRFYELERTRLPAGKYDVSLRSGVSRSAARRVTKACSTQLDERAAVKACKKILQDIVLGRFKLRG